MRRGKDEKDRLLRDRSLDPAPRLADGDAGGDGFERVVHIFGALRKNSRFHVVSRMVEEVRPELGAGRVARGKGRRRRGSGCRGTLMVGGAVELWENKQGDDDHPLGPLRFFFGGGGGGWAVAIFRVIAGGCGERSRRGAGGGPEFTENRLVARKQVPYSPLGYAF